MKRILEICCTSLEDAKIASDNGADRIELCEDLEVGGVTPNLKLLESVLNNITLPVFVLVRPRGGHFFYNYDELDISKYNKSKIYGILIKETPQLLNKLINALENFHKYLLDLF